jgi:hypothetical protein
MSHLGRLVARLFHVRGDTVSTVGLRNLPEAIRSLGALANPDYVDLYTVTTSEGDEQVTKRLGPGRARDPRQKCR